MALDLKKRYTETAGFLATGVWRIRLRELPPARAYPLRALRAVLLAARGFVEDKCPIRASSLTFFTLMSIVPVMAMAFGVAKGFGLQKRLKEQLAGAFAGQEEILTRATEYADALLETAKGGLIAGVGVVVLFWSVIRALSHIESSFNDIWEVRKPRPIGRRASNYFAIMLLGPVAIIISGSATVFVSAQIRHVVEMIGLLGVLGPVIFLALEILPYAIVWALLAFVYITVPNTKVRVLPGLAAAVISGTLYQLVQFFYITFQIGISKYNAIYGSFAALPLFLVWLQLSWVIVLFGAELSFAFQRVDDYEFDPDTRRLSPSFRKILSLLIANLLVKDFARGAGPAAAEDVSARLDIPERLTEELIAGLVGAGVVYESVDPATERIAYQPALDINLITIGYVLEALEGRGEDTLPVPETQELKELRESLGEFRESVSAMPANRLLRDV